MFSSPTFSRIWPTVLCCLVLAGCVDLKPRSDPTRFYVLSDARSDGDSFEGFDLVIRGVTIPDYLNRLKIAVRNGSHEVIYEPFHRWGSDLNGMIAQSFSAGIESGQSGLRATIGETAKAPVHIYLDVRRFEGSQNGEVDVAIEWRAIRAEDGILTTVGRITQSGNWIVGDIQSLVAELDRLSQACGREMVSKLREASAI